MNNDERTSSGHDFRQLEFAMEASNLAWWEMDCRTGALSFQRHMTDMLGQASAPFTQYADLTALLHPADVEPAAQAMRDHLEGVRPEYRIDCRFRTKAGAYRWFQNVARVRRRDEAGCPLVVTGVLLDISDRKEAERALEISEQRFRMLAESTADALWVLDDETERYLYVSPSIVRIAGQSAEEMMQHPVGASLTAESYAAQRRVREQRVQEFERGVERTYVDVVEQTHRNGSRVIIEVHGRFVRNAASGRLEVIGVSRDVTERRRVEEERERLVLELRQALDQVKTLQGILPICSYCKKIRDDQGYWQQVEAYLSQHTEVMFSHGICRECMMERFPEFAPDEDT